ncbi:MAG TPA: metalloregulator ArsR/SmtB family transcription factor [Acidimicrobiales bacterium]|nr:metalloregulator ArsR/SmtB family transcription factor [Acidimicrobiales bacterium]
MPIFADQQPGAITRSIRAAPSLASDLDWLLLTAASPSVRACYLENVTDSPPPASMCGGAAMVFDDRPGLAERVRTFWGESTEETSFTEMQILAYYSGALYATNPDVLWEALERGVATVPLDLHEILSESPEELVLYSDRFRRLKESPALVREYIDLMKEVWAPVDAMWQQALPTIEEAGRHFVSEFERGTTLDVLITPGCDIFRERVPEIKADIEGGKAVVFVPCLFFGSSMYLDFPDLVLIGTGVRTGDAEARARTESVARRLKAVADPTRLAMLHSLAAAPSTVGELSARFRLAQPTVSMHVKVLRQHSLVRSERLGGRLQLSADPAAVDRLLGDLREAVFHDRAVGAGSTGSERMPDTVVDRTLSTAPVTA